MPSPHWQLNDPDWLRSEYLERDRTGRDLADEIGVHPSTIAKALERHGILKPAHRTMAAVPAEWLREQHQHRGRSTRDMAEELGVAPRSVQRALEQAGIPVNNRRLPAELDDPEWLAARDHLSLADIAHLLGCSKDAVTRARRRHGLRSGGGSRFPQLDDPDWLQDRYHRRQMTQQEIADEVGCSRITVTHAMQRLGIAARPPRLPLYRRLRDREWLAEQLDAGRSPAHIAAELGCHRTTVTAALENQGLR